MEEAPDREPPPVVGLLRLRRWLGVNPTPPAPPLDTFSVTAGRPPVTAGWAVTGGGPMAGYRCDEVWGLGTGTVRSAEGLAGTGAGAGVLPLPQAAPNSPPMPPRRRGVVWGAGAGAGGACGITEGPVGGGGRIMPSAVDPPRELSVVCLEAPAMEGTGGPPGAWPMAG